jgi:hypothetical protein
MENFNDFIGSVALAVFKKGLKNDTELALIVSIELTRDRGSNFVSGERRYRKRSSWSYRGKPFKFPVCIVLETSILTMTEP